MPNDDGGGVETKREVVVVFGVFDLLHPGHIFFLEEARRQGDRLIVVVARDERIEAEKGRRPYYRLEERIAMLTALECVSAAVPGDPAGEWTMVRSLEPDVICVGHDQDVNRPGIVDQMSSLSSRPRIVRIAALNRDRYSTSALIDRLGFDSRPIVQHDDDMDYARQTIGQTTVASSSSG